MTERYGLIGRSLSHSFSQDYFRKKFAAEKSDAVYENFELERADELPALCAAHPDLNGLNVTVPYKEAVMSFIDETDPVAAAVGAVNTIAFRGGRKVGFNTDVIGFRESIKPFLTHGTERALILGTGGASKAVAYVLRRLGIVAFFVSRNPRGSDTIGYGTLTPEAVRSCLLIVNTTPLGTAPRTEEMPELPYDALTPNHLLYDLVYNPAETAFMREGKLRGATVVNGLSMLKIQAEASLRIWREGR